MSCLPALPVIRNCRPGRQKGHHHRDSIAGRRHRRRHTSGHRSPRGPDRHGPAAGRRRVPDPPGRYYLAVKWAQSFGAVLRAGVEGTSSYGAGLTRALQDAGIEVAEINRSDRAGRRRQGKSDPLDAYAAARAALAGHGLAVPKDEHTTALRALLTARRGAVKARTAAINQIKSMLITAPVDLRERYRRHTTTTLICALARCRPSVH